MATIVIRSTTKELITGSFSYEWSVHQGWRDNNGKLHIKSRLITRSKAQQIIQKLNLKECYSDRHGEIYDTPEDGFKAMFPDGVRGREDNETIEKINRL